MTGETVIAIAERAIWVILLDIGATSNPCTCDRTCRQYFSGDNTNSGTDTGICS